MNHSSPPGGKPRKLISRRNFLVASGGVLASLAGAQLLSGSKSSASVASAAVEKSLSASALKSVPANFVKPPDSHINLAGTDGWVSIAPKATIPIYHPDPYAVNLGTGKTTYIFGFRNVTGLTSDQVLEQKGKAQLSAPILYVEQESDTYINLTNLGLQQRPDLVDSHTVHWHGFQNAIPLFDGVPEMSIAVPISRDFTYFYRPHDPGTYMYHCHFEDVEHVQMGMTGVIFVKAAQNQGDSTKGIVPGNYVYNDGVPKTHPASSYYDREFVVFLNEINAKAHYYDAHIQVFDWSEYSPDFYTMNGRVYPDTLLPNYDPMISVPNNPDGSVADGERLRYQPISTLIKCNAGDKVLLRIVNLGYAQHAMATTGLPMKVVGKDAIYLKNIYTTNEVYLGPGESYDVIFTAPAVTTPTTFLLYNRHLASLSNGDAGNGGQMTEIRVSPAGTLPPQTKPNT